MFFFWSIILRWKIDQCVWLEAPSQKIISLRGKIKNKMFAKQSIANPSQKLNVIENIYLYVNVYWLLLPSSY